MRTEGDVVKIELRDIKNSDDMFAVSVQCSDCGSEVNRSKPLTGKEIWKHWTMIVMSSGFVTGKCKQGCRSTFSDLNINTDLVIVKLPSQESHP